jgi:tetratricopeptide (TPR) repeat protein
MEIFHLTIGERAASSGSYPVRLHSGVGDSACRFLPPLDEAELARLGDGHYGGLTGRAALKQAGVDLFQSVFVDDVQALYRQAIMGAKRDGPFRIVLTLEPDELHSYPWELMHDGERFLAATGHTQLVRRIGLSAPATREVSAPLRVLVAVSDAIDVSPDLDIRAEVARIASALDAGDAYVEIQPAMRHVIQARLREEAFDVVHFCGHGGFVHGEGCLCFEKEDSRADFLPATAFAALVEARSVPVVLLSACESGVSSKEDVFTGVAQVLVRSGVAAVVAMRSSLSDVGATDLVRDFYSALRLDFDVVTAITEARRALYADRLDWHVPIVYTLHADRETLEKAPGVREAPCRPAFELNLGLRPSVTFELEFRAPVVFTKRPEQVRLGAALVASSPQVVSVDGPPGSGKTAIAADMARRAAQQYRGGVLGLDCRTTGTLDAILVRINEALLEPCGDQVDLTQPWGRKALSSALAQRPFLIVLDNFESVLDQGGKELQNIFGFLRELPAPSKALVTSRDRLDVGQRVRVRTLDMWPFALLLARAGKRRGVDGFDQGLCDRVELVLGEPSRSGEILTDEERRIFDEAHVKLGGLPFAAEIFMGLVAEGESIADLLRDLRPVHERMTGLLDLSSNRLSEGARELLVLMSVFTKPVKRGAVRAVCGRDDCEVLLEELVKSSLVEGNRYSLHPLVREYAAARALEMPALHQTHAKAAEYFLSDDDSDPLAAIHHFYEAEEAATAVELTNAVAPDLWSRGFHQEAVELLSRAMGAADIAGDELAKAASMSNLAAVHHEQGEWYEAIGVYRQALRIFRRLGDRRGMAAVYGNLGLVFADTGRWKTASGLHRRALRIQEALGDKSAVAACYLNLALALAPKGQWREAAALCGKSLDISRELGDQNGIASAQSALGSIYLEKGDWRNAIASYEAALKIYVQLGSMRGLASIGGNVGTAALQAGEWDRAIEIYQASIGLKKELGDVHGVAQSYANLGTLFLHKGMWDRAAEAYEHALTAMGRMGDWHGLAQTYSNLGIMCMQKGEFDEARQFYTRGLEIMKVLGDPLGMAKNYSNLGLLSAETAEWGEAIRQYKRALALYRKLRHTYGLAQTYGNLGLAHAAQGAWDDALRFHHKSLEMREQVGDLHGAAQTWANLSIVYSAIGNDEAALSYIRRAIGVFRRLGTYEVESAEKWEEEIERRVASSAASGQTGVSGDS